MSTYVSAPASQNPRLMDYGTQLSFLGDLLEISQQSRLRATSAHLVFLLWQTLLILGRSAPDLSRIKAPCHFCAFVFFALATIEAPCHPDNEKPIFNGIWHTAVILGRSSRDLPRIKAPCHPDPQNLFLMAYGAMRSFSRNHEPKC